MAIRFSQHARKRLDERLPLPIKEVERMIRKALPTEVKKGFLYKDSEYLRYGDMVFVIKRTGITGGKIVVITLFEEA